jgi:hypothetical protein
MNLLTTVQKIISKIIFVYNIASWNANGLTHRIKEVEVVFLNTQKIDILLVSETRCAEQNYVNIPNCISHATNLPTTRMGEPMQVQP